MIRHDSRECYRYEYIYMLVHASCYMKTMHVEVFISAAIVLIYMLMNEMTRLLILVYELL